MELCEFHWLLSAHIRERVYWEYCKDKTSDELDASGIRQGKQESYRLYAKMIGVDYEDVRQCIKIGRYEKPSKPSLRILSDMGIKEEDEEYIVNQPVKVKRPVYTRG